MYQIDKPDNVVEILEQSVVKYPKRPFLGTKNINKQYDWITYEDFGKRVDNVKERSATAGHTKRRCCWNHIQ